MADNCGELPSPSRDASKRFPTDQLLRRHGYRIHSRPRSGEAWWVDEYGEVVAQTEALKRCGVIVD